MKLTKRITGKMVQDVHASSMQPGDYISARNVSTSEKAGVVRGAFGNRLISTFVLPAGVCRVIGRKEDPSRNRIIYMLFNENGYHSILQHSFATNQTTKILANLTDTDGVDILGWDINTRIQSIGIIHRPEDEGDLLGWTSKGSSPHALIIDKMASNAYGIVTADLIEAAKRPPLGCPKVEYRDDSGRNVNTLRRKLFQFQYRYVYDTFEKSSWSPLSSVPLPVGLTGTDNEMLAIKNNYINLTVQTGGVNVTDIEIAVRTSIGSAWSDTALAVSLDKTDLGIDHNASYEYRFYNDGLYPALDPRESILLFDWVPRTADVLEVVNGNTMLYAGITEGFDRMKESELNVSMTAVNVANAGTDTGQLKLSVTNANSDQVYTYVVTGFPVIGAELYAIMRIGPTNQNIITLMQYVVQAGDDIYAIASGLYDSMDSQYKMNLQTNEVVAIVPSGSHTVATGIRNLDPTIPVAGIATPSTWNWWSRYKFALVYFDEQGRTAGAQSKTSVLSTNDDFDVETLGFQTEAGMAKTPVIKAQINHRPPAYAKKFQWARSKNLAMDKFLYYGTHNVQTDADYFYFGLQNLEIYKEKNSNFNYGTIEGVVASGDRLRVISGYDQNNADYGDFVWGDDYEILGVEERVISGENKGKFVKVRRPLSSPGQPYADKMHVLIYSPAKNVTDDSSLLYSEFGEVYDIIEDENGERLHAGGDQNQSATQPATFSFENGDVYFRDRILYASGIAASPVIKLMMMDAHYSDNYASAVNSNGRAQVADVNMKEQYYPVMVRFSQEYVSGTNVNSLNRFYYDNFQEYDRGFGEIRRLNSRDRYLRVYQRNKCGQVPVYTQIMKDAAGNSSVLQSDRLLNDIQYYAGEFGIGDADESLASNNFADYFLDNKRGVVCRLSLDGLTPLSITEGMYQYSLMNLKGAKAIGVFNPRFNQYILSADDTLVFNESRNGFESFLDLMPECYAAMGNTLYAFKNGQLYVHDEQAKRCNFFGVQYLPKLTAVFNASPDMRKQFISVGTKGSTAWDMPEIQTSIDQFSDLRYTEFTKRDGMRYAPLLRDKNSPGGISRGDKLAGTYLTATYAAPVGNAINEWEYAEVVFIISNSNNR